MRKLLQNLQFVFKPDWWLMNGYYNEKVDKMMNHLLDNHEFTNIGWATAYLGGVKIWIANQPYACMIPHDILHYDVRPSRLTILKGLKKLSGQVGELKNISQKEWLRKKIEEGVRNLEEKHSINTNNK